MFVVIDDRAAEADQGIVRVQPDPVPARHRRDPATATRSKVHLAARADAWSECDVGDGPVGIPDLGVEHVGEHRSKVGAVGVIAGIGAWLTRELSQTAARVCAPVTVNRVGSMLTVFFTPGPVTNLAEAKKSDLSAFARFFQGMLQQGVYLPPSQFEAWFVSAAHSEADLEMTVAAVHRVLS